VRQNLSLLKTGKRIFLKGIALFGLSLLASCSSTKDTAADRGMQNLTARYNILYNARILIDESERSLTAAFRDDYTRLIPVFSEPSETLAETESQDLDKAIGKLNVIISEKASSQYVDDAYFLIAKANHLKAQFFNAAEFFDYLYRTYPDDKEKNMMALAWKARSLIALENYIEAGSTLDSAEKYMGSKSKAAPAIYASRAQLHIIGRQDSIAVTFLEKARKLTRDKALKLRWTFLLAQLHELNGDPLVAQQLYTSVIRSNAPFDLAFNAQLNRIALQKDDDSRGTDAVTKLAALLKEDKNKAFQDQIYFEIGKAYARQKDFEKAVESFRTSLRTNTGNPEQKGLTFLSLAELYFSQSRYEVAKRYYDSTLQVLPETHPRYQIVHKTTLNLDLLTTRLTAIAKEDTLQMLAALPEPEREERIAELVRISAVSNLTDPKGTYSDVSVVNPANYPAMTGGKFYFNNTAALSQGFSDFKRRWGNRRLEDNWRTGQKSSAQMASNVTTASPGAVQTGSIAGNPSGLSEAELRADYLRNLPLTPELRAASDRRIMRAYDEVAGFYRDVLGDDQQAILTYTEMLRRFPRTDNTPAIYYNLYRLYSQSDREKALEVKNILLTQFPETPFAKTILDPDYGRKLNDRELAINQAYNGVYRLFEEGKYAETLSGIKQVTDQFPNSHLAPQLAYLEAISIGHLQKLPAFESRLKDLIATYPADSLITPLARLHLQYIENNRQKLSERPYAIVESDGSEPRWIEEPVSKELTATRDETADKPIDKPALVPVIKEQELASNRFNLADSAGYYFVVNVLDPRSNLNSSRFGIGQFNRTKYRPASIKHQLKRINNQNQLIFVGLFNNKEAAFAYYREIMPLMNQIMKVPADRYNAFIITQEDFEKLGDLKSLEEYIKFYHNTLNERTKE
jgi:tetratricopeptide (TPR) repeat protein